MIVFNEKPEDIVEEQHVCYYTTQGRDSDHLLLNEVVRLKLRHPEARDYAFIFKYETKMIKEYSRRRVESGHVIVLEAAQNTARTFAKISD